MLKFKGLSFFHMTFNLNHSLTQLVIKCQLCRQGRSRHWTHSGQDKQTKVHTVTEKLHFLPTALLLVSPVRELDTKQAVYTGTHTGAATRGQRQGCSLSQRPEKHPPQGEPTAETETRGQVRSVSQRKGVTSELRTSGLDGCREQAKGEVAAHVTVQRVSPLAPSRVTGHSPGCLARACSPRSHTPFSWPPRQTAPHLMYDPPALNPWTSSPYTLTASVTSSSLCL